MTAQTLTRNTQTTPDRRTGSAESRLLPLALLLPGLAVLLAVIGFPMLYSLYLSFTNYTLTTSATFTLSGWKTILPWRRTRSSGRRLAAPCSS